MTERMRQRTRTQNLKTHFPKLNSSVSLEFGSVSKGVLEVLVSSSHNHSMLDLWELTKK